jgi:nucleoside-diphosphate-sugar epimerase
VRVVVTGASGFLGGMLAERLVRTRELGGVGIDRLVLADQVTQPDRELVADPLVEVVRGDLAACCEELFAQPVDVVFHLAAAVSAACEADFELGLHANVDATRAVLDAARAQAAAGGPVVRLVFASSIAVYGSSPDLPLPAVVSETTLPLPQSSYGTQKLMCEQLITDMTRRGLLDGRVVRLMTVAVRPGAPNAAASSFISALIREPLAARPTVCPVDPALRVAVASPRRTIQALTHIAEAERGTGPGRLNGVLPVNLPALTVSVAEILAALREIAGGHVADLVSLTPDPAVEAIVGSWPAVFDSRRAAALGLWPDPGFLSVVRDYVADHRDAVTAALP